MVAIRSDVVDAIRRVDPSWPMSDRYYRQVISQPLNILADFALRLGVKGACHLIKNQDFRIMHQCVCQRDSLTLPAR